MNFNGPAPLNLRNLEEKTLGYFSRVQHSARTIADEAMTEFSQLREETQQRFRQWASKLDAREKLLRDREEQLAEEIRLFEAEKEQILKLATQTAQENLRCANTADQSREESIARQFHLESDSIIPPLHALVNGLSAARTSLVKRWEDNLLQVAATIASAVIHQQLPKMQEVPIPLLREALELALGCSQLKIWMNPTDVDNLRPQIEQLIQEMGVVAKSELVADDRVAPGGCLVETPLGLIDQSLESRIKRIISELSS